MRRAARNLKRLSPLAPRTFRTEPIAARVCASLSEITCHLQNSAAQKIKENLIHKAKVKKSYAKLKEREQPEKPPAFDPYADAEETSSPTVELHPERQAMLDSQDPIEKTEPKDYTDHRSRTSARSKPRPFEWEARLAEQKREEARARQLVFEASNRERQEKAEERERLRNAMAKARRPDRNGQRKLGRESKVLLEKVKKLVGS